MSQMLHHRPGGIERMPGDISQLRRPIGLGVTRQGHMGDIPQPEPRVRQQSPDGLGRFRIPRAKAQDRPAMCAQVSCV